MEVGDLALADALAILAEIEAMVPQRPPKRRRRRDVIAEALAETFDAARNEKILGAMRAGSLPADVAKAHGITALAVRAVWGSASLGLQVMECSGRTVKAAKAATSAIRRAAWAARQTEDLDSRRRAAQARREAAPPGSPAARLCKALARSAANRADKAAGGKPN